MSDDPKVKPQPVPLEIALDPDMELGDYVNMARIVHTPTEVILDAIFRPPQSRTARVMARLILHPMHAKQLHAALGHNLQLFEQKFGPIEVKGGGEPGGGPILH